MKFFSVLPKNTAKNISLGITISHYVNFQALNPRKLLNLLAISELKKIFFTFDRIIKIPNCSTKFVKNFLNKKNEHVKGTYCIYFPKSINITMIALSLKTLRRKICLLNLISGSIYFFSRGLIALINPRKTFHITVISSNI